LHEYGTHAFRWENKNGDIHWVKIHIRTLSGIKNLTGPQAKALLADKDYAQRDMVEHLDSGKTAEWELCIQAVPEAEVPGYKWNLLDPTKVVSQRDYPLIRIGKIILNRNVDNYFAETEQAAFSPGNFVPGMGPTTDRILQGRLFSYPDTHRYRVGANFEQLPINCPYRSKVANCIRDGPMQFQTNIKGPNYEPNSANNGKNTFAFNEDARYKPYVVQGLVAKVRAFHPEDDFSQPGTLFRKVFDDTMREHTIDNIANHLMTVRTDIKERCVKMFYKADSELGDKIGQKIGIPSVKSRL
jgi:catalase